MLFTQTEFIFIFLPTTLVGYYLLGRIFKNSIAPILWLTAASLYFYSFFDIAFLPVIGASIIVNFALGRWIGSETRPGLRKFALFLAVTANLVALGFFKYTNFLIHTVNALHPGATPIQELPLQLPLGISFFTFTQIAYLADVYSGYGREKNFGKYALFVTYFPHLVAGPILHHREMMPQFGATETRRFSADRIGIGLTIFAIGLFKKAVIADGFALIANPVFTAVGAGPVTQADAWAAALAYSLQIYFDFSGYSDMAIGLSKMFGIVLPFNFDSPYKARSIVDFWRRWHITLSRFLRDYVYIVFGGNRRGEPMRYLNLFLTFLLGGLWHGAAWTFVIWGALHGLYSVINHAWLKIEAASSSLQRFAKTLPFAVFSLILTQFAVVVAWVFFRAEGTGRALRMLSAMFGLDAATAAPSNGALQLWLIAAGYLWCLALPNVSEIFAKWSVGLQTYRNPSHWSLLRMEWTPRLIWAVFASIALVVGYFTSLAAGDGTQFLYFQF